jgi:hypothetical protein
VFLLAAPGVALTLAKVIESLLSSYERIRELRKTATSLEEQDAPPSVVKSVTDHANERMDLDIDALTHEIVGQSLANLDAGRANEVEIEVKHSLRRLATRIDEGYSIEVRAFTPPDGEEEAETEGVSDEAIDAARSITERQPRMRSMNLTGRPILELEEADDDNDEDAGSEPDDEGET